MIRCFLNFLLIVALLFQLIAPFTLGQGENVLAKKSKQLSSKNNKSAINVGKFIFLNINKTVRNNNCFTFRCIDRYIVF